MIGILLYVQMSCLPQPRDSGVGRSCTAVHVSSNEGVTKCNVFGPDFAKERCSTNCGHLHTGADRMSLDTIIHERVML